MAENANYKDFLPLAEEIVDHVGGKENITNLFHCVTRLRMTLSDNSKLDMDGLKSLKGVMQVMDVGGQIQVVIGPKNIENVYKAAVEVTGIDGGSVDADAAADTADSGPKKVSLGDAISGISKIFTPIIPALIGCGLIKVLITILTSLNVLSTDSGTYQILYAAGDSILLFLPVALAITSADHFKANRLVALALAGALIYPDIVALYTGGTTSTTFAGLPVQLLNYQSTVLPAIVSVWFMSVLEHFFKKHLPKMLSFMLTPFLCLLITVPLAFLVIGPVTNWLGSTLAAGYSWMVGVSPLLAGLVLGFFWPILIIFGVHWGFAPIVINNLVTLGYDTLFVITGPVNFAQSGACLGVFLKTKNAELKETAGASTVTGVLTGTTEPAIYGVNLKYKKPFVIAMIFSGIAGAIVAVAGSRIGMITSMSLMSLPLYAGTGFVGLLIACAIAFVGSCACTYLFGFNDSMIEE